MQKNRKENGFYLMSIFHVYRWRDDRSHRDINRWINRKTGVYAGMFVLF